MGIRLRISWALLAAAPFVAPVQAQDVPNIGFQSVGRSRPLPASVRGMPTTGPERPRAGGPGAPPAARGGGPPAAVPGVPPPARAGGPAPPAGPLNGYLPNELPASIKPLPVDLFTSNDFYADKALWSDPRYFRCNSPYATELQRGILQPPGLITSGNMADGPWGHCEIDYPREAIVSPYGFKTAQEHYEALLAETTRRGGPHKYTFDTFPAVEWNGVYQRPTAAQDQQTWYWLQHSQISTVLSLLTPEYQQRFVQEAYHQVRGHALWPSTFCWPEGFMRRYYPFSVWEHHVIATPDLVQITAGVARNFITNIYVGRQFKMDGPVPYLSEQVPRWYGETIGFWDGDVLITWTSNIQGWKAHSAFEFSNNMQSVEIYTPNRNAQGAFVGLNHETILYDSEALAVPVRIVRNIDKLNNFADANAIPHTFIECVQTIFSIDGVNTPLTPGAEVKFEMPDMYGRPWAAIWEKYFEQGMTRPKQGDDVSFDFN